MASETITRNDLTNILNEVLPPSDILETVNATKVGSIWTAGNIVAYRKNGVVTLKINGATFSQMTARTVIANIADGYRPPTEMYGLIDGTTVSFYVKTNGDIAVAPIAAGQRWGAITYITA